MVIDRVKKRKSNWGKCKICKRYALLYKEVCNRKKCRLQNSINQRGSYYRKERLDEKRNQLERS